MDFSHSITAYYQGEKAEAILLTIVGALVCAGFVFLSLRYPSELVKGLRYPVGLFILIALFAGSFNAYNNARRLRELPGQYAQDQAAFIQGEIQRFDGKGGVNTWWLPLNIAWSLLVVAGLTLYVVRPGFYSKGLAIGVLFLGFSGLLIDAFAKQRAVLYTEHLYQQQGLLKKDSR